MEKDMKYLKNLDEGLKLALVNINKEIQQLEKTKIYLTQERDKTQRALNSDLSQDQLEDIFDDVVEQGGKHNDLFRR